MPLDEVTAWEIDPAVAHVDFATDPLEGDEYHRVLADLRSRHRVAPVRVFGQQAWLVVGFHELKDFCRRDAEFPGGAAYAMNTEPVVGRTFMSMEGSDHDVYRQLATPAFRSRPSRASSRPTSNRSCTRSSTDSRREARGTWSTSSRGCCRS